MSLSDPLHEFERFEDSSDTLQPSKSIVFSMQNAHGAPKEIPPGGAQKSASNPKVSKRCESETQINKVGGQETKMKKEALEDRIGGHFWQLYIGKRIMS